ncbi:MAG: ATPase domain-containing protein [Candidatus ainarchaeum sp.]|nr:ATPase domain-containing protein [Candidatus ainarchaeum sp.]
MPVARTLTGVPGLDEILFGGIPANSLVVISGDPGSGKTCLCMEYLYAGALKYNEPGVFISLEEPEEEIIKTAENFGWDFRKLIAARKLAIIYVELYDFDKLKNTIEDAVARLGAKRLVIDPGVIFRLYFERELDARKRILSLAKMLKRLGCTAIITNEISLDKVSSLFGLEEYVADGVILLYHTKLEDRFVRSIGILKMRETKISEKLHPIDIEKDGIKILAKHELFEEVS